MSLFNSWPEIGESELATAMPGVYRVRGQLKRGDYYRAATDEFQHDIDLMLVARVDQVKELPGGCHAEFRTDGLRLLTEWVPVSE